jgi:hypothetical protein
LSILGDIVKGVGSIAASAIGFGQEFESVYQKVNPNIAKDLSSKYGCTIMQADAPTARAKVAAGINPCTNAYLQSPTAQQAYTQRKITNAGYGAPGKVITVPPGGGTQQMSMIPSAGMSAIGQVARLAPGIIRTATGRISSIVLPTGTKFSARKAASLIRRVGLEAAAAALGVGVVQVAEILLTTQHTRRRRGISYAQLRNAKRVSCTIARMARDLNVKPATRRRTSCR